MIPFSTSSTKNNASNEVAESVILVIDGNAFLNSKLSAAGYHITSAENIHETKKMLQGVPQNMPAPDAIICNSEIDEKSILHLAGVIAATKAVSQVPFILYNERKILNSYDCLQSYGIDDLITPETSMADLEDKVKILRKYKSFQKRFPYSAQPENESNINVNHQTVLKRAIDITVSALILTLLSPLLLLIAICIKLESKGPVFYKSLRAGTGYKVFTFFKFRTMIVNADAMVKDLGHLNEYKDFPGTVFFKIKNDPRVTRIGQFLRKTSLDELPQLINVLKGDMSLVGNRPLPLYEAASITVDKSAKRFLAPAGITGLWQVQGRSNDNLTVDERISMDIDYADKHSLLFDIKILLKTPKELILKNNV